MVSTGNIQPVKIEDEMQNAYLDYAMSVIVSRALPDVRDGLKPVHRRILYAMHELGMTPNSPHRKCARIVGEVLGKFHPHGDGPVYDSLVRMAQNFSLRYPLIDGQGNFGSIDDDPPAAMRYTEARLAPIAQEMLANIEQDTVPFAPNFDDSIQEPRVLPTKLPNLLVNGTTGIAVGMTTSIPPHNLGEICDALMYMIDHAELNDEGNLIPGVTVDELLKLVKGPDFPTAATVKGVQGIREAFETGYGRVTLEAKTEMEEDKSGRSNIIVKELPYMLNKASLVEKIALLIKEKKVEGMAEVRDESNREGIRIVIGLSRTAQKDRVLNNLFKHTPLRTAIFYNMVALVDGQPRVLPLGESLYEFIKFRQTVIVNKSIFELKKAKDRAHILEGLRVALSNLEAVIDLIRKSADVEQAREQLKAKYDLSPEQAQAILDMQLRRIASLEQEKIETEYANLQKLIVELESIISSPQKVLSAIKDETQSLKERYKSKRRTIINTEEAKVYTDEELIPNRDVVVTLSNRDYLKSIPLDNQRLQRRGGRGSRGQVVREDDSVQHLIIADTHDRLLFFTKSGRVYVRKCWEVRMDDSKATRGVPIINVINIDQNERISAMLAVPNIQADRELVLATKLGQTKRMALKRFANIRSNGLIAINLKDKDELVSVKLAHSSDDVIIISRNGQGIRFPVAQMMQRSRTASTTRGIRLVNNDSVISMDIAVDEAHILTLSEQGFGKLTPVSSYPVHNRGGQGVRAFRITDKTGPLAAAEIVSNTSELIVGSAKAMVIRVALSEIPSLGRQTSGVMVMRKLGTGDRVVSVACLTDRANEDATS